MPGKFAAYVLRAISSISTAAPISNPARFNPRDKPPQPAKTSIAVKLLLGIGLLLFPAGFRVFGRDFLQSTLDHIVVFSRAMMKIPVCLDENVISSQSGLLCLYVS